MSKSNAPTLQELLAAPVPVAGEMTSAKRRDAIRRLVSEGDRLKVAVGVKVGAHLAAALETYPEKDRRGKDSAFYRWVQDECLLAFSTARQYLAANEANEKYPKAVAHIGNDVQAIASLNTLSADEVSAMVDLLPKGASAKLVSEARKVVRPPAVRGPQEEAERLSRLVAKGADTFGDEIRETYSGVWNDPRAAFIAGAMIGRTIGADAPAIIAAVIPENATEVLLNEAADAAERDAA